ncbi:MAG: membrane protein insertion efficiency factor YidD [Patescibacteria group bacterium]|nr:membrane protein insertion efficiency factor YidD [Patescibacteria group bacterium]
MVKNITLKIIKFYQNTLSMDHGWFKDMYPKGYCRFYPSCSQYAYDAINHHGIMRGGFLAAKRLCKCHPYNPGGVDLVKK